MTAKSDEVCESDNTCLADDSGVGDFTACEKVSVNDGSCDNNDMSPRESGSGSLAAKVLNRAIRSS